MASIPTAPPGPALGLSYSQPIELPDSQDPNPALVPPPLAPPRKDDDEESLIDWDDDPPRDRTANPKSKALEATEASDRASSRSDSTTTSSHRNKHVDAMEVDDEDRAFINDDSQQSTAFHHPSQSSTTGPSLAQELAALSPPGEITDKRLLRRGSGTYTEYESDDDSYSPSSSGSSQTAPTAPEGAAPPTTPRQDGGQHRANMQEGGDAAPATSAAAASSSATAPGTPQHAPHSHPPVAGNSLAPGITSTPAAGILQLEALAHIPPPASTPAGPATRPPDLVTDTTAAALASAADTMPEPPAPGNNAAPCAPTAAGKRKADGPPEPPTAAASPNLLPQPAPAPITTPIGPDGAQAAHLVAVSFFRTKNGGHPKADGLSVRDAASATNTPPTGCTRFTMPGWWRHENADHILWATTAIQIAAGQIVAKLPPPHEISIRIHRTGWDARQRHVDVFAPYPKAHLALTQQLLTLDGDGAHPRTTLAPPSSGLVMSPRYLPIRVLVDTGLEVELRGSLAAAFPEGCGIFVIEAWRICSQHGATRHFTNEIVALLCLAPRLGQSWSTPLSAADYLRVPGFMGPKTGDGWVIRFQHRPNWCWSCKIHTDFFHVLTDCANTSRPCGICNRRDHTPVSCPRRQSMVAGPSAPLAHANPFPAIPDAPAPPSFLLSPDDPTPTAPLTSPVAATAPALTFQPGPAPAASSSAGSSSSGSHLQAARGRGGARGRGRGRNGRASQPTPITAVSSSSSSTSSTTTSTPPVPAAAPVTGAADPTLTASAPTAGTPSIAGPSTSSSTSSTTSVALVQAHLVLSPSSRPVASSSSTKKPRHHDRPNGALSPDPNTSAPPPPPPVVAPFASPPPPLPAPPIFPSPLTTLTILSFNCGRGGLRKRLREFAPAARTALATADIICLQECNVTGGTIAFGDRARLTSLLSSSPPSAPAPTLPLPQALLTRDTGIFIRNPAIRVVASANGPRWCYALLLLPHSAHPPQLLPLLAVFSIHGPFRARDWAPISDAIRRLHPDPSLPCIIGADWNSLPDPLLDSWNARPTAVPWSAPETITGPLTLVDAFRHLQPATRAFTYFRIDHNGPLPVLGSARRLDSIWCSRSLLPSLSDAGTVHTSSDHRAVHITLGHAPAPATTAATPAPAALAGGGWTLHPALWRSPAFSAAVRHFASSYPLASDLDPSPLRAWFLFSLAAGNRLRHLSQSHGSHLRELTESVAAAAMAIDALDWTLDDDVAHLPDLLHHYHASLHTLDVALSLPLHSRLAAAELRSGSWLANVSASTRARQLPTLIVDGSEVADPGEKVRAVQAHFAALYSPPPLPAFFELDCARLLSHLSSRVPTSALPDLSKPFSTEEVSAALRAANRRSSPGPDGLTYRALIELLPVAGPLLAALANSLGAGESLPVVARSILLPKAGEASNLANYRPISISDAWVRTLARMLAARLLSVGDALLPWAQAAFLPGRRTTMVAGLLQGLTELSWAGSPLAPRAFFVVSLDQQKAYDRVRHEWLFLCLRSLGIPDLLINLLHALYSSPSTRFETGDGITDLVFFLCGVLQGDPSSCIIYNLTLQPLLDWLGAQGVGIDVPGLGLLTYLAFADDVLFFIEASDNGTHHLRLLLSSLSAYEQCSNARINVNKSSYWLVGEPSSRDIPATSEISHSLASLGLSFRSTEEGLVHLGHPIPSMVGPAPAYLVARIAAIRARALCFPTFGVSLLSRVHKAKRFLTSRLWHTIAIGALPQNFSDLYFSALDSYLFAGERPYVSRSTLTLPPALGGFGLLHPDHMAISLSISFLRRYLPDTTPFGTWLRAGLVSELRRRFSAPPAVLLLPTSSVKTSLQHPDNRAHGFFGRLLHALASVDLGLAPGWAHLPGPALLTLPWAATIPSHLISEQNLVRYTKSGWITWADMLWLAPRSATDPSADSPPVRVPPPHIARSAPPPPYQPEARGGVPRLPWSDLWSSLPSAVRASFAALSAISPSPFLLPPPPHDPSLFWRPLLQDSAYSDFPWLQLSINGVPLKHASASSVRAAILAKDGARVPRWDLDLPAPSAFWTDVWSELAACPLDPDTRSACLLALGRNVWTFRKEGASCPAGCPEPDSPTHGLCTCPQALRAWTAALPLARALGISEDLPFTVANIVGAWPSIPHHRPRLVLWRCAVLAGLVRCRTTAGAVARASDAPPRFDHCDRVDFVSLVATLLFSTLVRDWVRVSRQASASSSLRSDWITTWTDAQDLLVLDGDTLRCQPLAPACPLSDGPPPVLDC